MNLFLEPLRAINPIDRIITCFYQLCRAFFIGNQNSFLANILNLIMGEPYLLISLSLVIIGFVIGVISRLIHS